MKAAIIFATIGIFYSDSCMAQLGINLIPNWSFEDVELDLNGDVLCPSSPGWVYVSEHWNSAYGSVDYFNECSNEDWPKFGVPDNQYGSQIASSGMAYALLAGYVNYPNWEDVREFLWMELADSLKHGQGYYWEAQVSLADSMNFALSQLGVLFSHENTRLWQQDEFFDAVPQIQNPKDSLLDSKDDWMKVSGQFVANGGEKYMTIGFFNRDTAENIVRVSNYPYITILWEQSAYYIDDVVLKEDNSIGIGEPESYTVELYPNPASELVNIKVNGAEQIELHFKDQLGRALLSQRSLQKEQTINVAFLHAGVYFVEVVMKDGVVVRRRFIKE